MKKAIGRDKDIHHFISDLILKDPVLVIIIDKITEKLKEVKFPIEETKLIEFMTFERDGVGLGVHAHLFEPIISETRIPPEPYKKPTVHKDIAKQLKEPRIEAGQSVEIEIKSEAWIKYPLIRVSKEHRSSFPGYKISFILETDIGEIRTWVTSAPKGTHKGDPLAGAYLRAGLSKWYEKHPELKVGDKLLPETIEPKKRYRLIIK